MSAYKQVVVAATLLMVVYVSCAMADENSSVSKPVREIKIQARLTPEGAIFSDKRFTPKLSITPIRTAQELQRELADNDKAVAEILEKVDFKRELVIVARWLGSNSDKIGAEVKNNQAEFSIRRGAQRDLFARCELFALPKDVKFSVGM